MRAEFPPCRPGSSAASGLCHLRAAFPLHVMVLCCRTIDSGCVTGPSRQLWHSRNSSAYCSLNKRHSWSEVRIVNSTHQKEQNLWPVRTRWEGFWGGNQKIVRQSMQTQGEPAHLQRPANQGMEKNSPYRKSFFILGVGMTVTLNIHLIIQIFIYNYSYTHTPVAEEKQVEDIY